MERLQKSQVGKMFLLLSFLSFLLLTPFISTSLRSSYLYFLFNFLILVLGVEAGIFKPQDHDKKAVGAGPAAREAVANNHESGGSDVDRNIYQRKVVIAPVEMPQQVEKKTLGIVAERVQKLKRCSSRPSLFFIGSCDEDDQREVAAVEEKVAPVVQEEVGDLSKQELFMKAEMFIGNFYKQLKMQREESWKKIHGLYHRAF